MQQKIQVLKEGQEGYGILVESDSGYIDMGYSKNAAILKEAMENPAKFLENPVVYCVLQRYDAPNKNRRIYPKSRLMKAVEEYSPSIKDRAAIGEVDHADTTNVSLNNVGLVLIDTYWEGTALMGVVYLPITRGFKEMGICSNSADTVANLLMHKVRVGISSRSIGSVKKASQYDEVQDDLQILCWDFVSVPSTHLAYLCATPEEATSLAPYMAPEVAPPKSSPKINPKLAKFMGF